MQSTPQRIQDFKENAELHELLIIQILTWITSRLNTVLGLKYYFQ